ncbi:hypothetical protein SAMN05660900_02701, partial [Megasphaera cerevisiae DSM 20462]
MVPASHTIPEYTILIILPIYICGADKSAPYKKQN